MGWVRLLPLAMLLVLARDSFELLRRDFRQWTLEEAVGLLNDSAWAKQVTFTRVVGGVGSGIRGEKEILNTFYVRILSADPIRKALARVQQLNHGYDKMAPAERRRFDALLAPGLDVDFGQWIVLVVTFRSNDAEQENRVSRFFQTETTESLQNRAFLSTGNFSQIRLAAFYPPRDEGVGARFVFPRRIDGRPVYERKGLLVFELDVPAAEPLLVADFPIQPMIVEGELIL
ncbi:MAG: hypothetical protein ACE5JX_22635 [Acidobacteriota bacterium]